MNEVRPGVIATDMTSVVTEKYDTMIKMVYFLLRVGEKQKMWQR